MNLIDKHFYPLLTVWILLSLLAAYNSSFRPALPVPLNTISGHPVLADSSLTAGKELADFPQIQSLNGAPVANLREINNAVDVLQITDLVEFSLSDGRTVNYTLIPKYKTSFIALNVIVALIFYALSLLVWKFKPHHEDRYFAIAGFLFGYSVMCWWTGLYVPVLSELVVTMFFLSYPLAFGCMLVFGFQFPSTQYSEKIRRLAKAFILGIALLFSLILISLFFWKSISRSTGSFQAYDDFYRIFRVFGVIAMAGSLLLMVYNERRDPNPVNRQKLLWIIGGFIFGTSPFFILWSLPQIFNLPSVLPEWVPVPFLFLAPAGFAVAIVKYRLFDIELVLSRSLTYGIVVALLIGIYIVVTGGLSIVVHDTLSLESPYLSMFSTILVASIFTTVRRNVQTQVDKRFFRIRYDRFRSMQSFMRVLEPCPDEARALELLQEHFQNSVPVEEQRFVDIEVDKTSETLPWLNARPGDDGIIVSLDHLHRFEHVLSWDTARIPEPWLVVVPVGPQVRWLLAQKKSGARFWQEDLTLAGQMARAAALQREKLHYIHRAMQEELERKQAERMNDWKTMLVAEVAHDLRAPLNTMLWKLQDRAGETDSGQRRQEVRAQIHRLQSFVQNLLVLSSVENTSGLKLHPFPVREQIDEVVSSIQSLVSDKELQVSVNGDSSIFIRGEPVVFQEVLLNILQNAAKFSAHGDRIRISVQSVRQDGGPMVLTTIKDHAGGIPDEILSSLSVPFFQRANKKQLREAIDKEDPKGFSLGLHISQEFTKLMNGRMELERWSEGTIVKLWFQGVPDVVQT